MIDHLVASTCLAVLAAAFALVIPRRFAGLRYAILFVAVLRFALPTPWLVRAGGILAARLLHSTLTVSAQGAFVARSLTLLTPPIRLAPDFFGITAWCGWAVICALLLAVQLRRLARGITGVREPSAAELEALAVAASDMAIARPVPLQIASSDCMPCGSGILRPRVIIPDGLSDVLGQEELRAVLAHELAHVRRHDNLVAAVVRVVASVFWFHPLLWWIERRMMAEREIACDQLVLAAGAGQREYAEGILKVCRMSFIGQPACAGAAGSNLKRRIDQILSVRANRAMPRLLRSLPVIVAAAAVIVPLTTGFLRAQSDAAPAPLTDEATATNRNGQDAVRPDPYIRPGPRHRRRNRQDASMPNPSNTIDIAMSNLGDAISKSVETAHGSAEKGANEIDSRAIANLVEYVSITANRNDDAIAMYRGRLHAAPAQATTSH